MQQLGADRTLPLKPADEIQNRRQYDAQQDARRQREIKGRVLPAIDNVPRQSPQRQPGSPEQHDDAADYNKRDPEEHEQATDFGHTWSVNPLMAGYVRDLG